ncbi:hypothetical protein AD930_11345 [Acetobacter malorum]|nr:hypothetical protein AD930_11345 [Acetobacter malorum]
MAQANAKKRSCQFLELDLFLLLLSVFIINQNARDGKRNKPRRGWSASIFRPPESGALRLSSDMSEITGRPILHEAGLLAQSKAKEQRSRNFRIS